MHASKNRTYQHSVRGTAPLSRSSRQFQIFFYDIKLPKEIGNLPVGHLQLEGRSATLVGSYMTIGKFAEAAARGHFRKTTGGSRQALLVLSTLADAVRSNGLKGWDSFRRTRQSFISPRRIYFFSPEFAYISETATQHSLARLHLAPRGINALRSRGIRNIQELLSAAKAGILDLRAAGAITAVDITAALEALSGAVTDGDIDWVAFCERRDFLILPKRKQSYSGRDFLWHFPRVCEEAVASRFGPAALAVLRGRIFRHPNILVRLVDVGKHLGVTKERVRLIEESIFDMLSAGIWQQEYSDCRFCFRPEFLDPLYKLSRKVQATNPARLSAETWRLLLKMCWNVTPAELGQQASLLCKLLGVPLVLPEIGILVPQGGTARSIEEATVAIRRFFKETAPRSISSAQVCLQVRATLGDLAPSDKTILGIVHSLPELERTTTNEGDYRIRFERLDRNIDRYERILRDHGAPMHWRELHSEIYRRLPKQARRFTPRSISKALATCSRFVAIGKSGMWALCDWPNVGTGTVADMAEECLKRAGTSLRERELFHLIRPLRPIKLRSIRTLLLGDRRFCRIAPAEWALISRTAKSVNRSKD